MTPEDFCNDVVGKPWRSRCEGPEAYDCTGLVKKSYELIDGIKLESLGDQSNHETPEEYMVGAERWQKSQPQDGALMICYDRTSTGKEFVSHVGRCLLGGVLHALGRDGLGQVNWHRYNVINRLPFARVEYWMLCR